MAGFNNRVAEIVLVVFGLIFALLVKGWGFSLPRKNPGPIARSWLLLPISAMLAATAASGALWFVSLGLGPMFEATYFMDRFCEQMAGDRLYTDFSFDYGPLLYYPSWWLSRILNIPVGYAYFAFLAIEWIAGIACVWYVVMHLRGRLWQLATVFCLVVAVWFTSFPDGGAQYTPLRFLLSSVCAIWVWKLWQKQKDKTSSTVFIAMVGLGTASFLILLFISPEQGFFFLAGTIAFFILCVRSRSAFLFASILTLSCVAITLMSRSLGLLRGLTTFNGGDFNLPLLIGAPTLILVTGLLGAICVTAASIYAREEYRLEIYLILLSAAAIPAAFARADPGHIFVNTLPALMVVTVVSFQRRFTAFIAFGCWFVYLFVAFSGHARPRINVLMHSAPELVHLPTANELPPKTAVLRAPLGYFAYLDGQVGPPVHTGRYYGFGLIFRGEAEAKMLELQEHPNDLLVLPKSWQHLCVMLSPEQVSGILKGLFQSPFIPSLRPAQNVKLPLCTYIASHYVHTSYEMPGNGQDVMAPRESR